MCKAPATTLYEFSTNFTTLPTISFVIPNLNDDMHDGTISQADTLASWDEDDGTSSNHIPTIFFGMPVKQVSLARPLTSKRFASTGSLGR
jgi:phosphatidylinositol-3-phosphatase